MKDKLLYTTKELFETYLRGKYYTIPEYQRGYKWETKDIYCLLKDINNFSKNDDFDLFYCLQNITLVENKDSFNVVDGQQRLTTLAIILSYLGEYSLINEKIQYNIREETEKFLKEYIYKSSKIKNIKDWEQLLSISSRENKDYDYQDVYYLFNAYKTVQSWFDSYPHKIDDMKDKILNHIKIIVNLPKNIDEQELFENLNGKRVPLDGADLIRALIITRVAKTEVGELDDSTKQNVLINERRVKIGLLLDSFNLWWSEENKQIYFRQLTKEAKISESTSVAFDDNISPINNLYKLYSLAYNDGKLDMDFFERKSTENNFLHEIQTLQRTIENWYNDRILYHLILFTIIYAGDGDKEKNLHKLSFKELYQTWQRSHRKDFISYLKNRISKNEVFEDLLQQINITDKDNETTAFQEMWYDNKLVNVSTLLDIISILSSKSNTKLPAKYFKAHKEDLEHIFKDVEIEGGIYLLR